MASYAQIYNISRNYPSLKNKVVIAVVRYARYVLGASQDEILLGWARYAIRNAEAAAAELMWGVVADSAVADAADVNGVTDEQIQSIAETLVNAEFKNMVA